MSSLKNDPRLTTLIPYEEIESGALDQIRNNLALPYLLKMAIMPDVHQGYEIPVGGIVLLDGVVSAGGVGVDIGCGVCHVATNLTEHSFTNELRGLVFDEIYRRIPVGFNRRDKALPYPEFHSASENQELTQKVNSGLGNSLGTLGGGNHFLELGVNREHRVTITIHSGSRNCGHSIAEFYTKMDGGLGTPGHFKIDSALGQAYLADMNFALEFALANRRQMMTTVLKIIGEEEKLFINENHNHAEIVPEGVLHRKGATQANKGQLGLIPGNMRDGVYITRGLGNPEYLCSASHGAGRQMSRSKAKKTLTMEEFEATMHGVVARVQARTLDEAPGAYKDLDTVVARQDGIVVNILDHAKPIINIKG